MTPVQIAYLAVIFIIVAGAAFAVMRALAPRPTKTRLDQIANEGALPQEKADSRWEQSVIDLAGPLAKLALPSEGWENSILRTRFMHAGYHARSVPMVYFAAKTVLALVLPGIFLLYAGIGRLELGTNIALTALLGLAAFGYYLPNVVLARLIALRRNLSAYSSGEYDKISCKSAEVSARRGSNAVSSVGFSKRFHGQTS